MYKGKIQLFQRHVVCGIGMYPCGSRFCFKKSYGSRDACFRPYNSFLILQYTKSFLMLTYILNRCQPGGMYLAGIFIKAG